MFICYVGLRGSGKSAYAAKLSRRYIKRGIPVYSNFELDGCYLYDVEDLGKYLIEDCALILDEAGIDISNREWKSTKSAVVSKEARRFWKLTRHYGIQDIHVFSQAFDFDITLRRLADRMYIIKSSIFPHLSILKPVAPFWDVDEDGQPCVKWKIRPILFKLFFRAPYYRYYNSFAVDSLPAKHFIKVRALGSIKRGTALKVIDRAVESFIVYGESLAYRELGSPSFNA